MAKIGYRKILEIARKKERSLLRDLVFIEIMESNNYIVPCFVCGQPVPYEDATLEHIIEVARGGDDSRGNLAISHSKCNHIRGEEFCMERNQHKKR